MKGALLFIVFNRPDVSRRVFEAIREARPPRLYIAADGPRPHVPADAVACEATRALAREVDWECDLRLLFRPGNLGCQQAVSSAISWFFEHEEMGIILEDDCLPDATFFPFCEELLERYRDHETVMHVGGNNFQFGRERGDGSYYFSIYNHIWGWASWRRAWRHYDLTMARLPAFVEGKRIEGILADEDARNYWLHCFVKSYQGEIRSWDYQWTFTIWERGGVAILPNVNLISNIGFGDGATWCQNSDSPLANIPVHPIREIVHPSTFSIDRAADEFTSDCIFLGKTPPHLWQAGAAAGGETTPSARGSEPMSPEVTEQSREQRLQGCIDEAVEHLQAGRPIKAMRLSEQALGYGIPVRGLNYLYAISLNEVGRHEEALEAARRELALNPGHAEAAALNEHLTQALVKPPRPVIPTAERGYHTSLPRETLLEIQNTSHNYSYRGVPMIKNPFDFAIYPILLWDQKPRTIIEIGSKDGGSALWLGDMLDNFGIDGHVYSLDIVGVKKVSHPRVTFLEGDGRELAESFSPEFMLTLPRPLLVIEDADHSYETSSHVLSFFHRYLAEGEIIVVEDGIISDLALDASYSSGPHRALKEFLGRHPGAYDMEGRYCDFFGYNLTWCTNGFLKRVAPNREVAAAHGAGSLVFPTRDSGYPENHLLDKALIREFREDDPVSQGIASQMSANERFQLYYAIRTLLPAQRQPLRFIEIGSYSGASLLLTHQALMRLGIQFQGVSVEPGGTQQFHQVVQHLRQDVVHLPLLSHEASRRLDGMFSGERGPELIFVDGDHTYEGVHQDILDYYPLLAPGGIMVFHDYLPALDEQNRAAILQHHGNNEPGIRRACRELMEGSYRCERIELPLLYPTDPTQTQPQLPIIPGVFSTLRAYRKPL